MTAGQMADDLHKRYKIRVGFRVMSNPPDMRGHIMVIALGRFGAPEIYGIGQSDEQAYDDAIERQMAHYSWIVECASEKDARKLVKKDYELNSAGGVEISNNVITISTGVIGYPSLVTAAKRANIGDVGITLD